MFEELKLSKRPTKFVQISPPDGNDGVISRQSFLTLSFFNEVVINDLNLRHGQVKIQVCSLIAFLNQQSAATLGPLAYAEPYIDCNPYWTPIYKLSSGRYYQSSWTWSKNHQLKICSERGWNPRHYYYWSCYCYVVLGWFWAMHWSCFRHSWHESPGLEWKGFGRAGSSPGKT